MCGLTPTGPTRRLTERGHAKALQTRYPMHQPLAAKSTCNRASTQWGTQCAANPTPRQLFAQTDVQLGAMSWTKRYTVRPRLAGTNQTTSPKRRRSTTQPAHAMRDPLLQCLRALQPSDQKRRSVRYQHVTPPQVAGALFVHTTADASRATSIAAQERQIAFQQRWTRQPVRRG